MVDSRSSSGPIIIVAGSGAAGSGGEGGPLPTRSLADLLVRTPELLQLGTEVLDGRMQGVGTALGWGREAVLELVREEPLVLMLVGRQVEGGGGQGIA